MTLKCDAKTRSGTPCKLKAGWATDHVGEGRCKLHGGNAGRPITHGRYSVKHRKNLASKVKQFLDDPEPANLLSELALMRALLQDYLDRFSDHTALPMKSIGHIFDMTESISRLVERISRILNQTALTAAEVEFLQARFVDLVIRYISNEQLDAFWNEFRASFEFYERTPAALIEGAGDSAGE